MKVGHVPGANNEEGPKALHGEMDRQAMPLVVQCATHKGGSHGLVLGVDAAPNAGSATINSEMHNGLQLIHETYEILW